MCFILLIWPRSDARSSGERGLSPDPCAEIVSHGIGITFKSFPHLPAFASAMGGMLRVWGGLWGSFLVSHPGECHLCEPAPAEPWHGRIYLVGDVSEEKTALGVTSQGHIPFFHLPPCPTATVAAPAALPERELLEKKRKKTPKIKGAGGGCDGMSSSPLSPFLEEC